jgi:methyl-accepting chemotaxis protein WspA
MMKSISIKMRLIGLSLLIVVFLIAIATMALQNLKKENDTLDDVYQNRVLSLWQLKMVSDTYAFSMTEPLQRVDKGEISFEEALELIDRAERTIYHQWKSYLNSFLVGSERSLVFKIQPRMEEIYDSMALIKDMLLRDSTARVWPFFVEKTQPVVKALLNEISDLMEIQLRETKKTHEKQLEFYRQQRVIFLALVISGTSLTIWLLGALIRKISTSLRSVTIELQDLAQGEADLSRRLPVQCNDEVGILTKNFNMLMDNFADMVQELIDADGQLSSVFSSIGGTWGALESTIERFTSMTHNVVVTARKIVTSSQDLVFTMQKLAHEAEATSTLVESSREHVSSMEATISHFEQAIRLIQKHLVVISDKVEGITSIVTTITKIADQTNLLSLNTAIAAGRTAKSVGEESGGEFTVIAREIRRLADQTSMATLDIEHLVGEMKTSISSSVKEVSYIAEGMDDDVERVRTVGGKLGQITEHVRELKPACDAVNRGVKEHASDAQDIHDMMEDLHSVVEKSRYSLQNFSQLMKQLRRASEVVHRQIHRFNSKSE